MPRSSSARKPLGFSVRESRTTLRHLLFLLLVAFSCQEKNVAAALLQPQQQQRQPNLYYFAIGSNMVPETMTSLRKLSPVSATAAVLPGYELAFDIPGNPWIEPSAASVRERGCGDSFKNNVDTNNNDNNNINIVKHRSSSVVHGVLYELTDSEFASLGRSEGVPLVYRWERCRVIPYTGDGECAGAQQLQQQQQHQDSPDAAGAAISAFVLTASIFVRNKKDIPPSRSYLQILQDGAAYWNMDRAYQAELSQIAVDPNVPGVSGMLLRAAKRFNTGTATGK